MQKLVFINGAGDQIDLTSIADNFGIVNWEGLSNTDLNIQSQQVPFEDGGVFLDALMEQREIAVTVAIQDNGNLELRYQKKRELISVLNPKAGEGVLIYTNDYLSKQIKAVPQIPLFENKNSNDAGTLKAEVAFTCCNPYWEDLEETTIELSLDETVKIENNGDKDTGFVLDFFQTDGVTNPKLTSITEDKIIKYDGELEKNLKISTETGNKDAITQDLDFNVIARNINLFSICKGRGIYLVGGSGGVLLTSEDLVNWKSQNSGASSLINSIVYSKRQGLYLLATGAIRVSNDAINWKLIGVNANYLFYDDVTGYVYAIDSTTIKRSFDCENWTVVYTIPEGATYSLGNNLLRDANGLYNLTEGYKLTSADGESWTLESTQGGTSSNIRSVLYRNGKYIAVGGTHIYSSSDGTSYTEQTFSGYDFRSVVYWDKISSYVVISRTVGLMVSSDGESWSASTTVLGYNLFIDSNIMLSISNVINKFTSISEYETIYSDIEQIYASCEGIKNGVLLSSGPNKKIYKSTDDGKISLLYESQLTLNSLCKIKDFVIACGNQTLLKSTDETNWISKATVSVWLQSVAYNKRDNVIIVVGNQGTVLRSTDNGETWTPQTIGVTNDLYSVCFSKKHNKFVAVGLNIIADSSDGISWNVNTTPPASFIKITCADDSDILIASLNVNNSGRIYKSTDIENWELVHSMPAYMTVNGLSYVSEYGYFFAMGYFGKIYISSSGSVWKEVFSYQENNYIRTLTFSKEQDKILFFGTIFTECTQTNIESVINKISNNSDMGLSLKKGINEFFITADEGVFNARIKFRQKYIGV